MAHDSSKQRERRIDASTTRRLFRKAESSRKTNWTRRDTLRIIGGAGMLGLAGCSTDSQPTTTAPSDGSDGQDDGGDGSSGGRQGGSASVMWVTDQFDTLDPAFNRFGDITPQMFNSLLRYVDGEIVGALAEDWVVENDTDWTFTLREGVTFHDGNPFTAEEMAFSVERIQNDETSMYHGNVSGINSVEVVDEQTLRLEQSEVNAIFPVLLLDVHAVSQSAVESDPEQFAEMPVGTGPFEITDRQIGESVQFERFDDYWATDEQGNQLPYLEELELVLISEPSTQWGALRGGEADAVIAIPPEFANQAASESNIDARGYSRGAWRFLDMLYVPPHEHPDWVQVASGSDSVTDVWEGRDIPTTDPLVREAVTMAIDRQAVTDVGYLGWAQPANGLYNPMTGLQENSDYQQLLEEKGQFYDPEGARELLDEAGYTGEPRFEASLLAQQAHERPATVMQQNLRDVGIDLSLDIQPTSAFWESIYQYEHMFSFSQGDFDVVPWHQTWRQWGTPDGEPSKGVWSKNLYSNEEFDGLIAQATATVDTEESTQLYIDAAEVWLDDAPAATIAFPETANVMNSEFKNITHHQGLVHFEEAYWDN